jgi:ABC-type multidrug transport system fused ATPase/permease subunit
MFSAITSFFNMIGVIATFALLGALFGFGCAVIGRMNYFAAAIAGAVLMVFANLSGVLSQSASDAAKQRIADLEAQNAKVTHDLNALKSVRDFEQKQAEEDATAAAILEAKYADILKLIEKHKDDASCLSPEELNAIGKLK